MLDLSRVVNIFGRSLDAVLSNLIFVYNTLPNSFDMTRRFRRRSVPCRRYLLISSPREQKVCFSRIHPGNSAGTAVKPLVDSGLMAPEGIAVDRKRGAPAWRSMGC